MIRYTSTEITRIRKSNSKYELSDSVLNTIKSIVKEVGAPSYIKTPSFSSKRKKNKQDTMTFIAVQKAEKARPILEDIQGILNKFSEKSFDKLKDQLLVLLEKSRNSDETLDFANVAEKIYEVVSIQSYNVVLYGKLYSILIALYPEFKELCSQEYDKYMEKFNSIKAVNPDTDYGGFCKANKMNEQIRSISKFYVELLKHDILQVKDITQLISSLQTNLIEIGQQDTPDENPCIEYSENIYILITGCYDKLKECVSWNNIHDNILKVRNTDKKLNKNISSKVVFKHMDIIDFIKKQ
jgi:hypothetical protein